MQTWATNIIFRGQGGLGWRQATGWCLVRWLGGVTFSGGKPLLRSQSPTVKEGRRGFPDGPSSTLALTRGRVLRTVQFVDVPLLTWYIFIIFILQVDDTYMDLVDYD